MSNNFNLRELTENNGLIEDYPYREFRGQIVIPDSLSGVGVNKIFSLYRYSSAFVPTPANALTYPVFAPLTTDSTHWWLPLTITKDLVNNTFVVPYSGLYWIHWMINVQNAIGNNSEYFSELYYVPQNVIANLVIGSGANVNRIAANNTGPVTSNCWMRYLQAGDAFIFRICNTEANLQNLTINVAFFPIQ